MRVLLYEHVSGGGYAGQPIPVGVLAEGYGILRAVAADLTAAGHQVTLLLDGRISKLNPPLNANCVVPIFYPREVKDFLTTIACINDAALIVAPETDQTLYSLVNIVEQTGKISLNCSSDAIQKVSDKIRLYENLKNANVPTPQTLTFGITDDSDKINQAIQAAFGYPAVFKPADGVSCSGISLVKDETQIPRALEKIKAESTNKKFLAQQLLCGEAASVSLLVADGKVVALSLNRQNVNLASTEQNSSYDGGEVPFDHPLKQEAFDCAQKAALLFHGLRGYVGVDLVLTDNKPYVVDINPRLTTSYVGLSKTTSINVAQNLVDCVIHKQLPENVAISSFACFAKVETCKPENNTFAKTAKLTEVISPPFPFENTSNSYSLMLGQGDSANAAQLQLERAKSRLLSIVDGDE